MHREGQMDSYVVFWRRRSWEWGRGWNAWYAWWRGMRIRDQGGQEIGSVEKLSKGLGCKCRIWCEVDWDGRDASALSIWRREGQEKDSQAILWCIEYFGENGEIFCLQERGAPDGQIGKRMICWKTKGREKGIMTNGYSGVGLGIEKQQKSRFQIYWMTEMREKGTMAGDQLNLIFMVYWRTVSNFFSSPLTSDYTRVISETMKLGHFTCTISQASGHPVTHEYGPTNPLATPLVPNVKQVRH